MTTTTTESDREYTANDRKRINRVLDRAELEVRFADLTPEQRARALDKKDGLVGKQLATWVLEGKNGADSIREANGEPKPRKTRAPRDPAAKELADRAKALAPASRTSNFIPSDARQFMDHFVVTRDGDTIVFVRDNAQGIEDALESATLPEDQLRAFATDTGELSEDDRKAVRKVVAALTKGFPATTLYGGKFALIALAALES
jgi:hypothetical protein